MPRRTSEGFTLLELVVALTIFVLISTVSYAMVQNLVTADTRLKQQSRLITSLQRWLMTGNRDMLQIVPYTSPIFPKSEPDSPTRSATFVFAQKGWSNPLGRPRSELQQVEYRVEENSLLRATQSIEPINEEYVKTTHTMMPGIKRMEVRYLNTSGKWRDHWPENPQSPLLPLAVEITVKMEDLGDIRQLFPVAGTTYDNPVPHE